jgi:hypothetical protein
LERSLRCGADLHLAEQGGGPALAVVLIGQPQSGYVPGSVRLDRLNVESPADGVAAPAVTEDVDAGMAGVTEGRPLRACVQARLQCLSRRRGELEDERIAVAAHVDLKGRSGTGHRHRVTLCRGEEPLLPAADEVAGIAVHRHERD